MATFDIRAIAAITITILLLTTYANATVRCNQVASALGQCTSYVLTGEGNPTVECCSGIKSLNSMATTDVEHQVVCKCLRNLVKVTAVNASVAAGLPGKCGVIVPFALSTTIDCSKYVFYWFLLTLINVN